MAVMHSQFEAIHPFTDGNGRTGRILCILYLIQEGLLKIPTAWSGLKEWYPLLVVFLAELP
jgi:fido (protein-threonine AMPylation protein)